MKPTIFMKNLKVLYNTMIERSNDVHSSVITALYNSFTTLEGDIDSAKLELSLLSASGKWLDYWGEFFCLPRLTDETDVVYRERILQEALSPKITPKALKNSIAHYLNRVHEEDSWTLDDIGINEPFQDLMLLSHRGTLSDKAMIWSSDYYSHGIIEIVLPDAKELTPQLISFVNTIKASGIQVRWSTTAQDWEVVTGYFSVNYAECDNTRLMETYSDGLDTLDGFRPSKNGNLPMNFIYYTLEELPLLLGTHQTIQTLTLEQLSNYISAGDFSSNPHMSVPRMKISGHQTLFFNLIQQSV